MTSLEGLICFVCRPCATALLALRNLCSLSSCAILIYFDLFSLWWFTSTFNLLVCGANFFTGGGVVKVYFPLFTSFQLINVALFLLLWVSHFVSKSACFDVQVISLSLFAAMFVLVAVSVRDLGWVAYLDILNFESSKTPTNLWTPNNRLLSISISLQIFLQLITWKLLLNFLIHTVCVSWHARH